MPFHSAAIPKSLPRSRPALQLPLGSPVHAALPRDELCIGRRHGQRRRVLRRMSRRPRLHRELPCLHGADPGQVAYGDPQAGQHDRLGGVAVARRGRRQRDEAKSAGLLGQMATRRWERRASEGGISGDDAY